MFFKIKIKLKLKRKLNYFAITSFLKLSNRTLYFNINLIQKQLKA